MLSKTEHSPRCATWRHIAPFGDDWRHLAMFSDIFAKWRHAARNGDCSDLKSIEINKIYYQHIDNIRQMAPYGAIWRNLAPFGDKWR